MWTTNVILVVIALVLGATKVAFGLKFEIDYDNDTFMKDGKPFQYVSGSFHYPRVHPAYWNDRLSKMRAGGCNAVQIYVHWNWHEPSPGVFDWEGAADLNHFLSLAQQNDLVVLARIGPYICGEWEFGGLPAWLFTEDPHMILRTSSPSYLKWAMHWYDTILPKIKPSLYSNGGPIVMVQIENEYGSWRPTDRNYTAALRDKARSVLGEDIVLYTTDGDGDGFLNNGVIPKVYATVDFGPGGNPADRFKAQRDFSPKGPLVNSEFYTGWLDHWGTPHSKHDAKGLAKSLDQMLGYNKSNINMYMYIGGTNFGYWNGANWGGHYMPVPTSYDYDSPVSEAGDITEKYFDVRDAISNHIPIPSLPEPSNTTKTAYGEVPMEFVSTVQDALSALCPNGPVKSEYPLTMEQIKFYYGFILYRFTLDKDYDTPVPLAAPGLRDRAMVMVNLIPQRILDRATMNLTVNITGKQGQQVDIFVENQGRIGFSPSMLYERKGILKNVTLNGVNVTNWLIYPVDLKNIKNVKPTKTSPARSSDGKLTVPSIYVGSLSIKSKPNDTFLDPGQFTKGQAIINDFNLGRYWPMRGPQVTLFVPGPVLSSENKLYLFELEAPPAASKASVTFVDKPNIDAPNHPGPKYKDMYLSHH